MKDKILITALTSFLFVFTFIIFGACELYISNIDYFVFSFKDLILIMLLTGLTVFAALFFIIILFRKKSFDIAVTFIFAITLCGYIQGNFLNIDLGTLNGDSIDWSKYTVYAVINSIICLFIIAVPFLIYYYRKNIWQKLLKIGSMFIIAIQAIAFIVMILTTSVVKETSTGYFSTKDMFQLSSGKNVVVFILDRFDNKFINMILEDDPQYLEPLSGFTYYRNMSGSYSRTYPSIAYMLTGQRTYYDVPYQDYLNDANQNSTFIDDINMENYQTKLLLQSKYSIGKAETLEDKVINVEYGERAVYPFILMQKMIKLSAFRYIPHALKSNFWMYTTEFEEFEYIKSGSKEYLLNDAEFYKNLTETKISLQSNNNCFTIYHLGGAHTPYIIDEYANPSSDTDLLRQSKGSLYIVYEYIRQMKEIGIYDSSTIIITADHGDTFPAPELSEPTSPIFFMKNDGEQSCELKISYAPVSQENFRATVISAVGGDIGKYGTPVEDVDENAVRERFFWMSARGGRARDGWIQIYSISGDINDFNNWNKTDRLEIKYPFYKD